MMAKKTWLLVILVCLAFTPVYAVHAQEHKAKSADEIAKELANPAGSLASLNFNFQYTNFKGDLPDSRDQESISMLFQPTLPFPVGDTGNRIIFRPAITVAYKQPYFDADKLSFENSRNNLLDTTFDLVYAGNVMSDKQNGYLWGIGLAGTVPTATDDDLAGDQWRFGPELFGGILRDWGVLGALVSNQWKVAGSNDDAHSTFTAQYFYAFGLGKGWQFSSSPVITYDWMADSDEALTLPLGIGLAKTAKFGSKTFKFQFQIQKYVEQPDSFGPDWLFKFTFSPVIANPFLGLFK